MSKKVLSMILVFTLVATLLAACGGGNNEENNPGNNNNVDQSSNTDNGNDNTDENAGNDTEDTSSEYGDTGGLTLPLVDEPVTLKWMLVSDNTDLNESLIAKEIEKRTGITLDIQAYASGTYGEKLKAVLASGQLPDLFHGLPLAEVNDMGSKGVVVPITDYLDELPNFSRLYVEENPWVLKSYSDDEGNMYTWPVYGVNRSVNHGFMYRKDIFDKHDIPLWTNTDEFYDALVALKEEYPDSYPYASKTTTYIFRDWAVGWGIYGQQYPSFYDEDDQQWKLTFTQPEYRDMLDFMKKLYSEELIDPEFLTDTSASWTTKMTTGKSFVTWDWIGRLEMFYNQVKDDNPEYDLRYGNPVGPENVIKSLPKIQTFGLTVANNDKKEVALKLLDYLSSPSGSELVTIGVEGETFEISDDGTITYPELQEKYDLIDITVLEDEYGLWLEGMYLKADPRSVYFNYSEKEQEAQDKMEGMKEPLDPVLKYTDEEIATLADLRTSILKAAEEFSAKYIMTPDHGDAEWEAWLKQAKQLGEDELAAVHNAAQERYNNQETAE